MNTYQVPNPNVNTYAMEDSADLTLSDQLKIAGNNIDQLKMVTTGQKVRAVRNAALLLLGGSNNFTYDDAIRVAKVIESRGLLIEIHRRAKRDLRVSDGLIEELEYLLGIRSSVPMYQMA
jgi:hypothetical protein